MNGFNSLNKLRDKDIFSILRENKSSVDDYFWEYYRNSSMDIMANYVRDICDYYLPQGRQLSIGCGHGVNEIFMADMCQEVKDILGMDVVDVKIESMNIICEILNFQNVKGIVGDAMNLDFQNESFEGVIIIESLSHVPDQRQVLNEAVRVLKERGNILVIDFNNGANPRMLYKIKKENKVKGIVDESPVNPYFVKNILRELGISNITIKPYGSTPFFTSLRQKLFSNRKEIPYWINLLWTKGFMLKGEKI